MKLRSLAVAGVAAAGLAAAPAAMAQTSVVTGVGSSSLSLSVPATVVSAGFLAPGGTTSFTSSAVAVVAPTGAWALKVGGTDNGSLKRTLTDGVCAGSTDILAAPLRFTSDAVSGSDVTSSTAVPATASPVTVSSGTALLDTVTVSYTQAVGAAEAISAGCNYANTLTYTVAAS